MAEGLVDVTDCYYGFPIALSYPHFLDADPALLEGVTGSAPNRSLHESFFILNPVSFNYLDAFLPVLLSQKIAISELRTKVLDTFKTTFRTPEKRDSHVEPCSDLQQITCCLMLRFAIYMRCVKLIDYEKIASHVSVHYWRLSIRVIHGDRAQFFVFAVIS